MLVFGVYEMHIQPNVMYTFRMDEARARIDNLIDSIGNYIKKGRCYTEQDLCKIYYKVKRDDPVWKPGDQYYPYRRDELIKMACDRIHPDDDDDDECRFTFRNRDEWREYCKQRGPLIFEWS